MTDVIIAILVVVFLVVYIISIFSIIRVYCDKDVDIGFWSIVLLVFPLVNTYIAVRFGDMKIDLSSLKELIKTLGNE